MYQNIFQYFPNEFTFFEGISKDTIFATLTTIGIFIIGYIASKRFESWKENKRLREYKEYFIHHLKSLLPKIDKQIIEYKELSEMITATERKDLSLGESLRSSLIGFQDLPFNDIYRILITKSKKKGKEKYEVYNQLIDCLNYFDHQLEYAVKNFDEYLSSYNQYVFDWEENGDMILRKQDEFISIANRYNIDIEQDKVLSDFIAIIHKWHQKKDGGNVDIFETEFVEPLRELCKNNITDPRSIILMNYVIKTSRAIVKLKHLKTLYSEYYSKEENRLEEKKDVFIKAIKYFE